MTYSNRSLRVLSLLSFFVAGCSGRPPAADPSAAEREATAPSSAEGEPPETSKTPEAPIQVGQAINVEGSTFLLSDFENESLEHALGGTWATSSDPHGLGTTLEPSPFQLAEGGAEESKYAIRIHGHFGRNVAPWPYVDVRAPFVRTDLRAFSKVRFWTKGDGKKYVLAIVRTAVADYSHYRAAFVAPSEWTQVELPLAAFFQPDWGAPRALDWRDCEALSFQPDASLNDESYDLWIDQIELVR